MVALVSVITTGLLAPLVALYAAEKRVRNDRAYRDIDQQAAIIREVAELMQRRWFAFRQVWTNWSTGVDPGSDQGVLATQAFSQACQEEWSALGPLSISLGPQSEIVGLFRKHLEVGNSLQGFAGQYASGVPFEPAFQEQYLDHYEQHKQSTDAIYEACAGRLD